MKMTVIHMNIIGLLLILIGVLSLDVFPFQAFVGEWFRDKSNQVASTIVQKSDPITQVTSPTPTIAFRQPPVQYVIPSSGHVAQTFNNCGPATLSMIMSYFGTSISQDELREEMRPFNNPAGGIDDKSIFAEEFVTYAQKHGFKALARPNGDIELLKKMVANDIPVVLRTWLHPDEDMGHFRIVRGYDDTREVLIQDDSYEGKDLEYSYDTFLSMWQPFNYGYIVVYSSDKEPVVRELLGEEWDRNTAYRNSVKRADKEIADGSNLARFNKSTALYYLGEYDTSVEEYEAVRDMLGYRTLWYQIEPFQAYLQTGENDTVIELVDSVLQNGNAAFSELYYFKGQAYEAKGMPDQAKIQYESALYYNKNYKSAQDALSRMNS